MSNASERNKKNQSQDLVEPPVSSETAPTPRDESAAQDELVAALKRAEEAEARAAEAEQQLKEATEPEQGAPTIAEQRAQLYDKNGQELCWNCVNHNKSNVLDAKGNCPECGFQKSKLYNGLIEAEKVSQTQPA